MEKAWVARTLEEPKWLDKEGKETLQEKAHGWKATHILIRPDMVKKEMVQLVAKSGSFQGVQCQKKVL